MGNVEIKVLTEAYDMAVGLVRYYTGKLKDADPYKQWEVNGHRLNSIVWINAHLCWSEDFLLLQALGAPSTPINWLEHYHLGSNGSLHETSLPIKTVLESRKIIHAAALAHLNTLTDEDLKKDNAFDIQFDDNKSFKNILIHAIRHEGSHAGQLGWLCKINGLATI